MSYIVKDIGRDALLVSETWLTGNISDQNIVSDLTPARYSFYYAARSHKMCEGDGIILSDSLKFEVNFVFARNFIHLSTLSRPKVEICWS